MRFLWLMFQSQGPLASPNFGFAGQEAGRELVMSLSLGAEELIVEPRLAIDFLLKLRMSMLNLDLVAELVAGRRLVMNLPGKSMNLSFDAEEPGVEPDLVIGSLWRVMMGFLSVGLVAGQAAGRGLVIGSLWRVMMG